MIETVKKISCFKLRYAHLSILIGGKFGVANQNA